MSADPCSPTERADPSRRRRTVWLGLVAWTVVVGVALWWLLHGNTGPQVWIVHETGPTQPGRSEQGLSVSGSDLGLQRAYPWILFGPYAALLAMLVPLERGRFRLAVPLNLAACVAFVSACQAINARTRVSSASFVFVGSERSHGETNRIYVRISGADPEKFRLEDVVKGHVGRPATDRAPADAVAEVLPRTNPPDLFSTGLAGPPPHVLGPHSSAAGRRFSLWSILVDLVAYGAVIGLAHSVHFYYRFRERERRALFLESNLAHARLNALRAQLQPHFLFNSLNAVVALLRRDPRLAEATLLSLSELLRLGLSQSAKPEVTLREEMQFVDRYLEIQQTRFGDRLRVERQIEPGALDCLVPALVLQPLIENAIRHGIEPSDEAGLVRLTARCRDDMLVMTVEDDGVGLSGDRSPNGTGIGLANLRARLETLYGARQALELAPRPEGGATVRVELPRRPVPASEVTRPVNPA